MKFQLLEANKVVVDPKHIKEYKTASDRRQAQIITDILTSAGAPSDFVYREAMNYSAFHFGVDPRVNPFIDLLLEIGNKDGFPDNKYMMALVDVYSSNRVNLSSNWITDFSQGLYDRTVPEFEYTVNILDCVSDESKLQKYFHDVKDIDISSLYVDGKIGGKIKPAGNSSTFDDTATIYGTVQSWSGDDGSNDKVSNTKQTAKGISDAAISSMYVDPTFDSFPKEDLKDGVIGYFEAPVDGDVPPDVYVNAWDPGFYIYSERSKTWTRLPKQPSRVPRNRRGSS